MGNSQSRRTLSYRQKRAVDLLLGDRQKSRAWAIRKAGYSDAVARHPQRVFGSPTVRDELIRRGVGADGLGNPLAPAKPKVRYEPPRAVIPSPSREAVFDPTKLTREQLQDLKEKLSIS